MRMKSLLLFIILAFAGLSAQGVEWPKAILPGDYPDPTIVRDGEDYYMTHSPFYYQPGFLIWHSRNLVDWEPVCRAVPEYEGSAMAPDLIKYGDRFYIYFPSAGTNWVCWADDIRGPWSKPVDLKVSGIDPGHIADAEGNRYLYVNQGEVIRLAPDGLSTIGEKTKVYDGWEYPKNWITEGMYLESPKLVFHDGYFYLTSAQGGTAGPPTSHMVASARSRSVTGPWENSPYNPVVHTYSDSEKWWSKGHGTIIDDVNGNWWIVYHAYPNGYHTLGRYTMLEPVAWTSDGWFHTKDSQELPGGEIAGNADRDFYDEFDTPALELLWSFWKENALDRLNFRDGFLEIEGKGTTPVDGRKILLTPQHRNYIVEADITVERGSVAGLALFYNEKAFAGVTSDGELFTVYSSADNHITVPSRLGTHFHARIRNMGNRLKIEVSGDGKNWLSLADGIDVSEMNHNIYKGFYALRPALVAAGKGKSRFDNFSYRDAVPHEKDMAAYLMVFHKDETHGLHFALSRDGYTFTALNDGNPVMSGDTISDQHGIRDPHIYRGPDGAFYAAMTDLHVFGQRDGFRDTEWERDGKKYAWGNNRGLVLLKSFDLIDWKRTNVRFDHLSAAWQEIGCAWAPEVIYDEKNDKMMIYLTMRHQNEPNKLYYVGIFS